MQKIDWIIAGVGVVALVATTLGVLYEDDLTGAQDITFTTAERTATAAPSANFATSTAFEAPAGINATAAAMTVTVGFEGNAVAPQGSATVRVTVTGPDGVALQPETQSMTIANAAGGGGASDLTFNFDLDFGMVPGNVTVDDLSELDESMAWDMPYQIEVTVTPPQDPFTGVPQSGANYVFSASATITESYYMHAIVAPELQGGA